MKYGVNKTAQAFSRLRKSRDWLRHLPILIRNKCVQEMLSKCLIIYKIRFSNRTCRVLTCLIKTKVDFSDELAMKPTVTGKLPFRIDAHMLPIKTLWMLGPHQ